jgi:hypothetical protein
MEITKAGPLREQSEEIFAVLNDSKVFHSVVVSNLESFSVHESLEMTTQMSELVSSAFSFIANKVYPVPEAPESMDGNSPAVRDFIQNQLALRDFQKQQADELLKKGSPLHRIPFLFQPLKDALKDDHRQLFAGL